jgi:chitinase
MVPLNFLTAQARFSQRGSYCHSIFTKAAADMFYLYSFADIALDDNQMRSLPVKIYRRPNALPKNMGRSKKFLSKFDVPTR